MCEKINSRLKRSIPVVKATTCLRSAIRNFVALSFVLEWAIFQRLPQIIGALGLDHVSSTRIVEWIAQNDRRLERARSKNWCSCSTIRHHWISWQRGKKEHKYYNTPCKFYPPDRAKGSRWAEGWNAYAPVIYLNETRCCKYFSYKWT